MTTITKKYIHLEEYVEINGIKQYLFHSGTKEENPVMLFLHGGPGSAQSSFAYAIQDPWEEIYTVVQWDQRGAGKTLTKNPNKEHYPTIEKMLEDLYEVIQYIKKKYHKERIILLGHSWGSMLGSIFIKKYPEEVEYYIGVGQVINMFDNERVGYEKLKEVILEKKNKKDLKKLEAIGDYPKDTFNSETLKDIEKVRKLQGKYDLAIKIKPLIIMGFKSPLFKWTDMIAFMKAFKVNAKIMDYFNIYNLNAESTHYDVPMYYILGENDWQTPHVLAREYFEKIDAPQKHYYSIPNA